MIVRTAHSSFRDPLALPAAIANEPDPHPKATVEKPIEVSHDDWRRRLTRNLSRRSDGRWDPLTHVEEASKRRDDGGACSGISRPLLRERGERKARPPSRGGDAHASACARGALYQDTQSTSVKHRMPRFACAMEDHCNA